MDIHNKGKIFVTCARGLQPFLADEMRALGVKPEAEQPGGLLANGTLADCMRLNLWLRTAHRVLFQLHRFQATNPDELFNQLLPLHWEDIIAEDGYLSVESSVDNKSVRDSRFANVRVKDAVVDRIAEVKGRRPDSGPDKTGVVLFLHWKHRDATLYLDTSGTPLSMRGYRLQPHKAPMRETLAAACLLAANYNGKGMLLNPMCGSGTLAIEGALIATGTAPGLFRSNFGFQHVLGHDEGSWEALRTEARSKMRPTTAQRIIATDNDPAAIAAARDNAAEAGMAECIEFDICDFRESSVPEPAKRALNLLICNPEYGKRMGDEAKLEETYKALGDFLKQHCQGYMGGIFTGNMKLAKRIGLRTAKRVPLMNGPIDCRLLLFELYAGTRKQKEPNPDSQ
ncbi:THUMP domain-containing class I SAM-dependent RNA methyltransferase [Desulfovibrio ferrophilus]|uniref:Putative RNA methylase n=1 Tax=Desulfovibrio ferrophilus TaxID=241368 RepID=A0A2Z6B1Y7_9BACT|nr:class I SAM-dependent RNA methyltransferase [Desulfovibrio ferrophilus]BBD09458.1 putative RNA methylase [Desulfovibrio ferrophilus]